MFFIGRSLTLTYVPPRWKIVALKCAILSRSRCEAYKPIPFWKAINLLSPELNGPWTQVIWVRNDIKLFFFLFFLALFLQFLKPLWAVTDHGPVSAFLPNKRAFQRAPQIDWATGGWKGNRCEHYLFSLTVSTCSTELIPSEWLNMT